MKSKKTVYIILAVLLVLTAALAAAHLTTREKVPEGAILVRQSGEERYVEPDRLFQTAVTGTIVNGKGEERSIDARGIALDDLAKGGYDVIEVTASDEYSALVSADEKDSAFLILNDDGSVQLVVFGDANSKRAVRNVDVVEFRQLPEPSGGAATHG